LNDKCRCDYDYPPSAPSALAPKIDIFPVKRLKCTSSNMKTGTSRYSRIDRLNDLNSTAGETILINVAVTVSPPNVGLSCIKMWCLDMHTGRPNG